MTISRIIMLVIAAILVFIPYIYRGKINIWLAIVCILAGYLIVNFSHFTDLYQERKENKITKNSPIIKIILQDIIVCCILVIGIILAWFFWPS